MQQEWKLKSSKFDLHTMKIPTRQPLDVHLNTCKKNVKYARQEKMANYRHQKN